MPSPRCCVRATASASSRAAGHRLPADLRRRDVCWYVGTELLSRATKETISEAEYAPANAVASVTLSGPDLAMNRSRERILNLLEGKLDNAEATMKNNITKAVYGDGTVAKSFAGLKAFVTVDGLGLVGGIDASMWTFWKNQFQVVTRATGLQYPALVAGMNALWMKLIRGAEKPDLIVADAEVYTTYESGLQQNQRYADARLGALGFETLKYKTRTPRVRRRRHRHHRGVLPEHEISQV